MITDPEERQAVEATSIRLREPIELGDGGRLHGLFVSRKGFQEVTEFSRVDETQN